MPDVSQPSSALRSQTSPAVVLAIVCAGVALASLDLFIVNVALPQIGRDLHLGGNGLSQLSWILNAYLIVYAALLVPFGRLAERHRRDRAFLLGVAVFVLASAACGAATSLTMLIVWRIVQAAGAALLTPASLGLILATFPAERRHGAVRTWTAIGGLAAAVGPVAGGLLVEISWRWVFFVNVPIGLLALAIGWRRLPAVAGHPVRPPDALGALLVTAGVGLLSLGLVQGNTWGWSSAATIAAFAAAAALIGLFAVHVAWHHNPLVDRELLRLRSFTAASVVAVLFSVAFGAMLLSRVLWAQDVWHWSALQSGLAIAPGPLVMWLCSFFLAGRLATRFGAGAVIAAGCLIFAAGMAWWAIAVGLEPSYVDEMLGGMLLTGAGVGLTLPTLMATGAGSLPPHAFATGSAAVNMLRQVGLAIGVAVLIAVVGTPRTPQDALHAYQDASWLIAGVAVATAGVGAALLARTEQRTATAVAREPA